MSENNEQNPFDLDLGFETETESGILANLFLQFLKWFILGLSAVTTAAFFFQYAGDAFAFLFGSTSPWVTAVIGATALDGLSQVWAYLRGHKANTMRQMTTARYMSWANLLASVVVTVVYLSLTAAFDIGVTAADGTLTQLGYTLNLVGVLIMIGSISGNFIAYHWYNDSDMGNQQAVQRTTLAATINQGRHFIETQRVEGVMVDTLKDILAQLPEQTRQAGEQNKESYFKRHFSRTSPRPNPNGREKVEQIGPPAPVADGRRKEQPAYQVWLHNGRRAIHMIEETYDWAEAQGTAKEAAESAPPGHYIIIKLGDGVVAQYAAPEAVEESDNGRP